METRAEMRTWRITHDQGAGWAGKASITENYREIILCNVLCNVPARGANFKKDTGKGLKGRGTITTVAVFMVTFNPHI